MWSSKKPKTFEVLVLNVNESNSNFFVINLNLIYLHLNIKYNYVPNTKITTLGIVNGSYYNGLQYVWAMAHASEMIINLPDLNE